jgi:uncharacterized protein YeeX (DUF496 family)
MALINIRDETKGRINARIALMQKDYPTRVTQDYVITKALDLLEGKKK